MSQSDYIKYKKTGVQLKDLARQSPILSPRIYTAFKDYNLENNIINTTINYNKLIPTNTQIVFDIERKPTNCPTFILCNGTQARSNRRPILYTQFRPTYLPKYVKHPENPHTNYTIKCKCKNTKCVCVAKCPC